MDMRTKITDEMVDQVSTDLASKVVKYMALEVTDLVNKNEASLANMIRIVLFALSKSNIANLDTLKRVCLENKVETSLIRLVNSLNTLTKEHAESLEPVNKEEEHEPAKVGNGDSV
jgi:hypothetical protein